MPVSAPLSIDDSRYSTSRPRKPIYVSIWTEIGVPSLRLSPHQSPILICDCFVARLDTISMCALTG